jgi:hypothetical protein
LAIMRRTKRKRDASWLKSQTLRLFW